MRSEVTVNTLLLSPFFRDYLLISGKDGLSARVSGATVMELLDGAVWIRPGTVIATVGINIGDDAKKLYHWIETMQQAGVSAIFLKLGRFIHTIPDEVIALSNTLALPLILMPPDTHPTALMNAIYEQIHHNQDLSDIQRFFRELIFSSGTADDATLQRQADLLGITLFLPYRVFYLSAECCVPEATQQAALRCLRSFNPRSISVSIPEASFLIFYPSQPNSLAETVVAAQKVADGLRADGVTVLVSARLYGIAPFHAAFEQLHQASAFFRRAPWCIPGAGATDDISVQNNLIFYDKLGYLQWLIALSNDPEASHAFLQATLLDGLRGFTPEKQEELIHTLYLYLQRSENLRLLSESMHIHKNTLIYRIRTIENALSCSIDNMDNRINLYLAATLYKYLNGAHEYY